MNTTFDSVKTASAMCGSSRSSSTSRQGRFLSCLLAIGVGSAAIWASPPGPGFTYQGRLDDGTAPATGIYDMVFTLHDNPTNAAALGSYVLLPGVAITNGLFTVTLNAQDEFGATAFNGDRRWLQIAVRTNCNCLGNFTYLEPRQALDAAPYAIHAGEAATAITLSGPLPASQISGQVPASQLGGLIPSANLGGSYGNSVTFNSPGNSFTGNGSGLTSLDASQLTAGTVPDARLAGNVARTNQVWRLGGNAGTGLGQFIGTTDPQPLELRVNTQRALRLESNPGFAPNFVAGHGNNKVGTNSIGAVIGGGSLNSIGTNSPHSTIGGGTNNAIGTWVLESVISGGIGNRIQNSQYPIGYAAIGGGRGNRAEASYSTISGGENNQVTGSTSTIGGGAGNKTHGDESVVAGGLGNTISTNADFSAILGGMSNTIHPDADSSAIGGGELNEIRPFSFRSTIGGGVANTIESSTKNCVIAGGFYSTIGSNTDAGTIAGGYHNRMMGWNFGSCIGGGSENVVGQGSFLAAIGGGAGNEIGATADYCVISGGRENLVATNADYATIPGGRRAKALHPGTFIWGDATDADISTVTSNSVTMRASRGYRLFTTGAATAGVSLAPGATSWSVISDRNAKKDFAPVNSREVLEKLASLPITRWHYRWEDGNDTPHLGPMAQDFKAAFYPGRDDTSITTLEADGVALAAIQGLNQKLEEQKKQNAELRQQLDQLRHLVESLDR